MALKIENVKVQTKVGGRTRREYQDFLKALRDLKVGQSFVWGLSSNDRMAISIAQFFLDREFVTRREGEQFRVGRSA